MTALLKIFSSIKINPLLWVIALIAVLTGHFREFLVLFTVVFLHELGHALAAVYFKWRLVKVELLPFGGVAEMDEYGNRPYHEELIVILAGPIQHVWMIALGMFGLQQGIGDPLLLELLVSVNWMILLFNLLPIWPLDGGKLLFLFITLWTPYRNARKMTLMVSAAALIVFIVISVMQYSFHLNLLIILAFLLYTHYVEWKHQSYVYLRFLLERLNTTSSLENTRILTVPPEMTVEHALSKLYKGYDHEFHVKSVPPYLCKEKDLLTAYFKRSAVTCAIDDLFR